MNEEKKRRGRPKAFMKKQFSPLYLKVSKAASDLLASYSKVEDISRTALIEKMIFDYKPEKNSYSKIIEKFNAFMRNGDVLIPKEEIERMKFVFRGEIMNFEDFWKHFEQVPTRRCPRCNKEFGENASSFSSILCPSCCIEGA